MGKSTAAEFFTQRNVAMIDTDLIARQVVEPGQPALLEIEAAFGKEMIASDGTLRRAEMARRVFGDPSARQKLESIVHPRIRKLWVDQVQQWRSEGRNWGLVVIPLLFETNAASHFDSTVCVACTRATQERRLQQRGWSMQEIEQRRSAQRPVEEKMAAAEFVIWTEGTLDVYAGQVDRILRALEADVQ